MNPIIQYLSNYAFDNKIGFQLSNELSSNTPCTSNTRNRLIMINMNWHIQEQIPFQFAHEIGHVMNDDKSDDILYFTPLKKGTELNANKFAINLLIPFYAEEKNISQLNISNFMNFFAIPSHLESLVIQEFNNYFNCNNVLVADENLDY